MSFEAVSLVLSVPALEDIDFARLVQAALAPVLRPLPHDFSLDVAAEAVGGLVRFPGTVPPLAQLVAEDLPTVRDAALFATAFDAVAPAWQTHAAFPKARIGRALLPLAGLWLYIDGGTATASIELHLSGFPLTDVTLEVRHGDGVLVPAPGRAAQTGDRQRMTEALTALGASFPKAAGRRWRFDFSARIADADRLYLMRLQHELNAASRL